MDLRKIKVYYLFWLVALAILIVGAILNNSVDNTLDINIHDTYYVIAQLHFAIILSLAYSLLGFGYWIVQKVLKRKLIYLLTMIHSIILIGSFFVYGLVMGYSKVFLKSDPFSLLNSYQIINQTCIILFLLIVVIGQPIYIVNLLIGIFKKQNLVIS
jgi:heme/copper-type cytochrome/quinol oxidase subunit 1